MSMSRLSAAAALMLVAAAPSFAGTKSFIISGSDLKGDPQSAEAADGVELDESVDDSVWVNFTLPKNYKKNSPVTLQARMFGGGQSCNVALVAETAARYRIGKQISFVASPQGGLVLQGAGVFAVPASPDVLYTRKFKLGKASIGPITNQLPGDSVIAIFSRLGASGTDTCTGDVTVTSVKVTYTTK